MSFLRKSILFVLLLLLLSPCAAFPAELGTASLSLIKGDVQIYSEDAQEWVAAAINTPLLEGDRLWVPEEAHAEIHIQGGVYVRLGSATSLDILALQEESYQFYLNGGHAYINNRQGGIDHIQVDTPLTSVGCYDNTLIMIDVLESGATDVSVIKGYAYAETRGGKTRVAAGNTLKIGSDMEAEISPLPAPDQWEQWNRERDRMLAGMGRSLRYVPDELDDYAYDLDNYGRWVYVADYGYCWTPYSVAAGWAPYRHGRWAWRGGSYVWISYEPWGWVPYHYGRWAFVARFGWCWVPPVAGAAYWGPGYVGWVYTPSYVAWVPLAPGDIYYGYGYYGPASVNITNVTINRVVVRRLRNVHVSNSVTVVNRDTFVTGRKERVRVRGNPFTAPDVEVGPPAIKPTRESARPVIKHIPRAKQPPERVRRVSVEEIKRERKLVPEEKGSVFRPQPPSPEMPVRKRIEPQRPIREKHPPLPPEKPKGKVRGVPGRAPEEIRRRPEPRITPAPPRERTREAPAVREAPPGKEAPAVREAPPRGKERRPGRPPRPEGEKGPGRPEAPQDKGGKEDKGENGEKVKQE